MAVIRWKPVGELNTIQNEMNRLFNTFFDQPASTGHGDATERRWVPPMDLLETADHYDLRADLPGVREDDVTVQLEDDVLTIAGQRTGERDPDQGYYRLERAFAVRAGLFRRTGVLTIHRPSARSNTHSSPAPNGSKALNPSRSRPFATCGDPLTICQASQAVHESQTPCLALVDRAADQ
jgi:HSP20 family molecular chaperone IbpA